MDRIIVLIDMDCFYVQVEQKLAPEYQNQPCAVVQYKNFKGGGIIAVNYEARSFGVKRGGMLGDDAKKLCPSIHLFQVPETRGKADLTKYRDASSQIFEVLRRFSSVIERASIDEAYLDVTKEIDQWLLDSGDSLHLNESDLPSTFIEGFCTAADETGVRSWLETSFAWDRASKRMALAAVLCERIRLTILDETGFKCSAGVAGNKMLSKFACGIHKPNKQTVVLPSAVPDLLKSVPIFKLRNFGGHLGGEISSRFQVNTIGELNAISRERLVAEFGEKNGNRIFNVVRGIDSEPVVSRQLVKSIGCGKNFRGPEALISRKVISYWLQQMSEELEERLNRDKAQHNRVAELLTVGALFKQESDGQVTHRTRCVRLNSYNAKTVAAAGFKALCKLGTVSAENSDAWSPPIINLSLTASKFGNSLMQHSSIRSFLQHQTQNSKSPGEHGDSTTPSRSIARKRWRSKFGPKKDSALSQNQTDDCEISWADEAATRTVGLQSPDSNTVANAQQEFDGDSGDSDSLDDDLDRSKSSRLDMSSLKTAAELKQKNLQKVSESIRSIIRNTLAAADAASSETAPKEGVTSDNSNAAVDTTASINNTAGQAAPIGGGGFFRRKALEREASASKPHSPTSSNASTSKENSRKSFDTSPIVIDLETPCTSRAADLAAEAAASAPKRAYYCSVDAASVDIELLKQMPLEIQREYASALGLNLNGRGAAFGGPLMTTASSNKSSSTSLPTNGSNNNRKRPISKTTATSSNKKAGKPTKKSPQGGRSSHVNKLPAITIEDFFR